MTTTCPVCGKTVDPLRSRFVGVIGGKVVAYCSEACAHRVAAVAEAARAADASRGVPAPVPEAGAVRSEVAGQESAAGPPRPVTPAAGVPVSLAAAETGPVIEIIREPASGAVAAPDGAQAAPRAPLPEELSSAAAPGTADAAAVTSREADDSSLIAEPPAGKSRWGMVLLVLAALAAAGVAAYRYLIAPGRAASPPPRASTLPPPSLPEPARPAEPPVISPAAAVEQARGLLHRQLAATSPRIMRLAAAALARTQDRGAIDVLAAQLAIETSDIAKLDLAYALARGGDPRGSSLLVAGVASPRAEVRAEAARLLALLGDARAVPHLSALLGVSQRRLGAAEHLAHLAEPRAIRVLEQIRGDARASADDKARATIALGVARHAEVAPALRDMLGDAHFNAFAAAALAELKDAAARPVLEQQLDSPPLRVRAACALRRLDPALDPRPTLPRLIDVLQAGRDTDQILAAEAILVLAGQASWSAHD